MENYVNVGFNKTLHKKYGKLYIDKDLINGYGINIHTINGFCVFILNILQKDFLKRLISKCL